jgi:hypothetical protein
MDGLGREAGDEPIRFLPSRVVPADDETGRDSSLKGDMLIRSPGLRVQGWLGCADMW